MSVKLRSPFPYYGSKIEAAELIEYLHGSINNLVIPFAGSLGELLGRSRPAKVETVNDYDGLVVNVWRALRYSPEAMAEACDHPVHEVTLHAAHDLLLEHADELPEKLRSHPTWHDVGLAAWWVWGRSCWLGGGWCDPIEAKGAGASGGMRVRVQGRENTPNHGQGVAKRSSPKIPRLSRGDNHGPVRKRSHRKRPALGGQGDRPHQGVGVIGQSRRSKRQIPLLRGSDGTGVGYGVGIHARDNRSALDEFFLLLSARLDAVRITCGPWQRTVTPSVTTSHGLTGVNLDPIYKDADPRLYRLKGEGQSDEVRAWAIENGDDPLLRITLCGRGTEHDETMDHGWKKYVWRKRDGETIWASPHCERAEFGPLFAGKNGAA